VRLLVPQGKGFFEFIPRFPADRYSANPCKLTIFSLGNEYLGEYHVEAATVNINETSSRFLGLATKNTRKRYIVYSTQGTLSLMYNSDAISGQILAGTAS
jgi:hypothetical protein